MIKVVHCKVESDCEYIGRPSPLGNPFTHKRGTTKADFVVASREEAVREYKKWLINKIIQKDKAVIDELKRLKRIAIKKGELKLGCWCAPKACHGDVIKEILERVIKKERIRREMNKK